VIRRAVLPWQAPTVCLAQSAGKVIKKVAPEQ